MKGRPQHAPASAGSQARTTSSTSIGLPKTASGPSRAARASRTGSLATVQRTTRIDDRQDSEAAVVQLISDDASGEPVEGPIEVIGPDAIRHLFPLDSTLLWMVAKGTKT